MPENLAPELGRRVADLRAKRAWTQQQLAERLAVSRAAVSHIEAGLSIPGERTVALLAGLFRMEPHELVAGTDYPMAKSERLPLVAPRWTEVEHQIDLLQHQLDWLDQDGDAPDHPALVSWEARLSALLDEAHDPEERAALTAARRQVGDRRRA